jgi:AcrR family transcriptional regulator
MKNSVTTIDEAPAPGRRQRKKLQTRRALQAAALRLALERGARDVTIEEIADAADVSPRTFFNYFSSKEEALVARDPDEVARVRGALAARLAVEPPLAALRGVLRELAGHLSERREEWLAHLSVVRSDPHVLAAHLAGWAELERELAAAVAERTDTDAERDLYPRLVVGAAVGAMRVAAMRWRDGDGGEPLEDLIDEAFDALGAGLPAPASDQGARGRPRQT